MNRVRAMIDGLRGRGLRSATRNHGTRAAAGITVMCLLAALVMGGAQLATSSSATSTMPAQFDLVSSDSTTSDQSPDQFAASVEKVVTIAADSTGAPTTTSVWAQTAGTGTGSTTVTVPVGTPNPVNLTSFSRLTTDGDSIIYPISTEGSEVVQDVANAGQFNADMPVEVDVDLKVNGEEVDPNTATSMTGNVELTYRLINKTVSTETLSFKDASGNVQTKSMQVAVPFSASYDGTFDKGWSNIQAPWAQSGFSSGLTVTGSATLKPTMLNKYDPNASWTLNATVENASLPTSTIKFQPQSSGGDSTVDGAGAEAAKITETLEKAGSLLTNVQAAIGKGSTALDKILKQKIDPILNMLSRLHVDPNKMQSLLTTGGNYLTEGGDYLLGINALLYKYTADATGALASATDQKSQQDMAAMIAYVNSISNALAGAAEMLPQLAAGLTTAAGFLTAGVPSALSGFLCPGGSACTWAQALGGLSTDGLVPACTAGLATAQGYLGGNYGGKTIQQQFDAYVTAHPSNTAAAQLKMLLDAQAAASTSLPYPADCATVAGKAATDLNKLITSVGTLSDILNELVPLITELQTDLNSVETSMANLLRNMPTIHTNMVSATALLSDTAVKDARAEKILNVGIKAIVRDLRPIVGKLAKTANLLGAAALPLESRLDELPGLIDQLGNGTLGFFVGEVNDLATVGSQLTIAANQSAAVTVASDKKFYAGEGMPYGMATGDSVETSGAYVFTLASADQSQQKTLPTVVFAIIMLIASAGVAIWLTRRRV